MSWLVKTLSSSVGKKIIMAFTGLFFCCFLTIHLIGNLTVYGGASLFNAYVEHLHAFGPLIRVAEAGLLICAVLHVFTGLSLAYQNFASRPVKYQMKERAGGRTLGSSTMPYTGILLLLFILAHLAGVHFADHTGRTVFEILRTAFRNPLTIGYYILAMIVAAVHVSHGFWSAFQTLGMNHEKYTPAIRTVGVVFSIAVGAGFGFIPIWISYFN